MSEKVIGSKTVFSKSVYDKTINTSFTQLTPIVEANASTLPDLPTIDEFFEYYQNLFFDIPKLGATNSHEYLVKTSGEYVGDQLINDEIQALLEEITDLRQELLAANQTIQDLISNG